MIPNDFCSRCGALVDWDAEADRRCRGCGEEIEVNKPVVMHADLVELVKGELVATFSGVAPETVAKIADEFLSMIVQQADTSAERALDSLAVCQDDGCSTITADAREHDGKLLCPGCYRATKKAALEASGIAATHGPEVRGVRGRRAS